LATPMTKKKKGGGGEKITRFLRLPPGGVEQKANQSPQGLVKPFWKPAKKGRKTVGAVLERGGKRKQNKRAKPEQNGV